jgi:low affinity Fe/Cu permease
VVDRETKPSEVDGGLGLFDRFADWVGDSVARAWFFAACVLLVVVWTPTLFFLPIDTSQLLINTATTIVTFLLVALLQNTQARSNAAVQKKLNAIAEALADFMDKTDEELAEDVDELRAAVGLEKRESTSGS